MSASLSQNLSLKILRRETVGAIPRAFAMFCHSYLTMPLEQLERSLILLKSSTERSLRVDYSPEFAAPWKGISPAVSQLPVKHWQNLKQIERYE